MITYAQNNEDVLLNRIFGGAKSGFYVDVGAGHPIIDSVTRHFYQQGWRGINIEPRPDMFPRLEADRPLDINLRIGVAESNSTATFFHVRRDAHLPQSNTVDLGGLSTFDADLAEQYRTQGDTVDELPTPVRTLTDIFDEYAPREISFLKVDVEGFERQVLAGMDANVWRPRLIVIESIDPVERTINAASWEAELTRNGYSNCHFDGINSFFVRQEDVEELGPRFRVPVNVLDSYTPFRHINATTELEQLKHRTGPRSLAVGLSLARQLHRWTGV